MQRIIDISGDNRHLSAKRGHMVIHSGSDELGRIPLDDIGGVIVHSLSTTYTGHLISSLADRGVLIVSSGSNHAPVAVTVPIIGHHEQTKRMIAQASATLPLCKRLWQQLVMRKIRMQAFTLMATGQNAHGLLLMERRVGSGDPQNIEATAARRYWRTLFGEDFRRDQNGDGLNSLLNYGYAVVRACVSRAIVVSGLNPSLGVHHHNRQNPFALADDLIEPFRPLVDLKVFCLAQRKKFEVTPKTKAELVSLLSFDLETSAGSSPVSNCAIKLAQSLASSFLSKKPKLSLPAPNKDTLSALITQPDAVECPS